MKNPLTQIPEFGQSVWLDYISRKFISSGELRKLIDEDGLKGVTSNPAIFESAIVNSNEYQERFEVLSTRGYSAKDVFWDLAIKDVQNAADAFAKLYKKTKRQDGYVSLEVSPDLAFNTEGTIEEARWLWKKVNRRNAMIKVPGTKQGLQVVEQLISEGINVNVTLIFGVDRYRDVAEAYIAGLERRARRGDSVRTVRSVASFFISRIDAMIDPMLEQIVNVYPDWGQQIDALKGKVAIASGKEAYGIYKNTFAGDRFKQLEAKGAKTQRLLWASTGTKNKAYSDVMYVDALIGPDTVNTVPMQTLEAYRDHGNPAARLEHNNCESQGVLQQITNLGIDLGAISEKLELEGIEKFIDPFTHMLHVIDQQIRK